MTVTAEMVRTLREATGAGMMECKKALVECEGDMQSAADFLRVKSGVKADKVAGRSAKEGRIVVGIHKDAAVLMEVNCETDFVARGAPFAAFCEKAAQTIARMSSESFQNMDEELKEQPPGDSDAKFVHRKPEELEQARKELVMQVGENVDWTRTDGFRFFHKVAHYTHTGGRIASLISYTGGDESLARDVCMHIAAMRPDYLVPEEIPVDEMQKQREIFTAQAAETGKPPQVAEKIAEGKLKKHFAERVLLSQPFVKDGDKSVGEVLEAAGMTIRKFRRLEVGTA